jgi:hypothetical protein
MHALESIFGILLVLVSIWLGFVWSRSRSEAIIKKWAVKNGFTVLSSKNYHFVRGPFFLRSDPRQTVYNVTIRDQSGQDRSAWVRCGGWLLGLVSDDIKVMWDNDPSSQR